MPDETFATDATNGEDQEPEVIESPVDEPEDKIEPEAKPESEGDSDTKEPDVQETPEQIRIRELEESLEGFQKSVRALSAKRNELQSQVVDLQSQLKPAEQEPDTPPRVVPSLDGTDVPDSIKTISPLIEPLLADKLYDVGDDTVYIGERKGKTWQQIQEDYANWVKPDIAKAVVTANTVQQQQAEQQRQTAAQQAQENLSQIGEQFDNTISSVREKMFPMFTDDESKKDVDEFLAALTASELGKQGYTLDGFGTLDEKHLDAVPVAVKGAVEKFRGLLVKYSQTNAEITALAEDNAPVAGKGARAGGPPATKLHELPYDDQIDAMTARAEALLREQHGKL